MLLTEGMEESDRRTTKERQYYVKMPKESRSNNSVTEIVAVRSLCEKQTHSVTTQSMGEKRGERRLGSGNKENGEKFVRGHSNSLLGNLAAIRRVLLVQ